MLFDLQGKRRRVVQATYLTLAVLMGGGLVLFGIGSDAGQGGLFDAIFGSNSGNGDDTASKDIRDRVDRNEDKLRTSPNSEAARKALVRDYYQLAVASTGDDQAGFSEEAKDELRKAAANWKAYLALEPEKPDASLAQTALQIFGPGALEDWPSAKTAQSVIAEEDNSPEAYVNLVQYATLAGDKRTADLAGRKAIDLSKKGEVRQVRAAVKQAKKASAQTPAAAGG